MINVEEHKIIYRLENNLHKEVLEYFDPMLFLRTIPVFLSESLIERITEEYFKKVLKLNFVDLYHLKRLNDNAKVENYPLKVTLDKPYVKDKLKIYDKVFKGIDPYLGRDPLEYFMEYPKGRINQSSFSGIVKVY